MITKITAANIGDFYNKTSGNLYFMLPTGLEFQVLEGLYFTLDECLIALSAGVEFIYIEGPVIC